MSSLRDDEALGSVVPAPEGASALDAPDARTAPAPPAEDAVAAVLRTLRHPHSLALHLQPIVDLARGTVVGHEVLSRFAGVGPEEVFAAAEAVGRGAALDGLVLERAVGLRSELPDDQFVTVNASPLRWTEPAWLDRVAAVAERHGGLSRVVMELTEHIPYADMPAVQRGLAQLRALGGMVALDDAGTGYSGLLQLSELRPDIVKADRALVTAVDLDPVKSSLIELLGTYAGRLDAWLLAEGVETANELSALVRLGVPLGQGFHLGRPGPAPLDLPEPVRERLRQHHHDRAMADTIAGVVSTPVLLRDGDFPLPSGSGLAVVVDEHGGPVAVLVDGTPAGRRPVTLRAHLTEPVVEVARRAMSRDPQHRFDPVLAVDARGRVAGAVTLEELVLHLARLPPLDRSP